MFILGIDVGTRNLGMCVVRLARPGTQDKIQVHKWSNVDLFPASRNVNKIELGRLITSAVDKVWESLSEIKQNAIDLPIVVAIERQPNCNPRMKALGASVYSACHVFTKINRNATVHFVSAGKKFKVHEESCVNRKGILDAVSSKATTRAKYAANTKDGILSCRYLLDTDKIEFFGEALVSGREVFDSSKKKDDLADSLLIALSYGVK